MSRSRWLVCGLVVVLSLAFGLRTLSLIDATGLWSDELYSVGKSFQPNPALLLDMLRQDTHPPVYYGLLWVWGQVMGQTPVTLRLLSWLAYVAGGCVMVAQTAALAHQQRVVRPIAMGAALVMVFCSPYPVRFAIEGKSYALLVLFVALAWWWRRSERLIPYGLSLGLAALTHFYGLFLFVAAALWDGWKRRRKLALTAALAVLPSVGWIVYASAYLFSSRSGSWIAPPDFALFEDSLARGLGLWPLPKLAVLLLCFWGLRRWGGLQRRTGMRWGDLVLLDRSGLIASLLMVLAVVLVSFVKPLAFSRYFVVLLPAFVPWLAVQIASFKLVGPARWLAAAVLLVLVGTWWGPGFAELDPGSSLGREQDQFAEVSRLTSGETERYSPRARLFNLSDQMELVMGRITTPPAAWTPTEQLPERLNQSHPPDQLWLASSGPQPALNRRLDDWRQLVEQQHYRCEDVSKQLSHAMVLRCRSGSKGHVP